MSPPLVEARRGARSPSSAAAASQNRASRAPTSPRCRRLHRRLWTGTTTGRPSWHQSPNYTGLLIQSAFDVPLDTVTQNPGFLGLAVESKVSKFRSQFPSFNSQRTRFDFKDFVKSTIPLLLALLACDYNCTAGRRLAKQNHQQSPTKDQRPKAAGHYSLLTTEGNYWEYVAASGSVEAPPTAVPEYAVRRLGRGAFVL